MIKSAIRCTVLFILSVVCVCGCVSTARTTQFIANTPSADSVPITYAVYGKVTDPTVVFVHGWSCDSRYWHNQIPYFAKHYRVVTIDLAGHGHSGFARKVYTTESFAQDVAAVLNKLDIKKAILVGHSMGGEIAIYASKFAPERVTGLIGVDTLQDLGMVYLDSVKSGIYDPIAADFVSGAQNFVRTMFPASADKALVDAVASDVSAAPSEVALSAMKEYFKLSPPDVTKGLSVPLKCINSDSWPTNVEGNKKLAPSFEVVLMKGRGHFLMLEDPKLFNKLLERMIKRILSA